MTPTTTRASTDGAVGRGRPAELAGPRVSREATAELLEALADLVRAVPVGAVDPGWEHAASVALGRVEAMEERQ